MNVVKLLEPFAVNREQEVHREALQTYGEKVVVRQAWTINDFRAGLVERCTQCQAGSTTDVQARVAQVYKQAGESYCSNCFGIGFDGGFKPVLYLSWALVTDQLEDWHITQTGRYTPANPMAQFIWTPHLQEFDMVSRFEYWIGDFPKNEVERDILREVQPVTLRTGPGAPRSTIPGLENEGVGEVLIVGQVCQIENLPQEHALYGVEMVPPPETGPTLHGTLDAQGYVDAMKASHNVIGLSVGGSLIPLKIPGTGAPRGFDEGFNRGFG